MSDVVQDAPLDASAELAALPPPQEYATGPEVDTSDPVAATRARLGGPVPFLVYMAMVMGALLGALAGSLYGLVLGQTYPWITLAFAALGSTYLGARSGKRRVGHPLKPDQRVRVALWYTSGLATILGPLVLIWPEILPKAVLDRFEGLSSAALAGTLALIVLSFGAVALLHYLLLSLFTSSGGRSGAGTVKSPA